MRRLIGVGLVIVAPYLAYRRLLNWIIPADLDVASPVDAPVKEPAVEEPEPPEPVTDDAYQCSQTPTTLAPYVAPWHDPNTGLDDYADDPRIFSHGPLVVVLADGRSVARLSDRHVWRLYRPSGETGQYWYRLDTALGHLLGHPRHIDQLRPAEEADNHA